MLVCMCVTTFHKIKSADKQDSTLLLLIKSDLSDMDSICHWAYSFLWTLLSLIKYVMSMDF